MVELEMEALRIKLKFNSKSIKHLPIEYEKMAHTMTHGSIGLLIPKISITVLIHILIHIEWGFFGFDYAHFKMD